MTVTTVRIGGSPFSVVGGAFTGQASLSGTLLTVKLTADDKAGNTTQRLLNISQ